MLHCWLFLQLKILKKTEMEGLLSGIQQVLGTIAQSRVIETVTEKISEVLPIDQEKAESIRKFGTKTQSIVNCVDNLGREFPKCQESRDVTRAINSVVKEELEKNPTSETGEHLQVLDSLTHLTQSVMSKFEEELEEFLSNQTTETASAGETVHRVGDVIKFSGSVVEEMLKTFNDFTMDDQQGISSCVEIFNQLKSTTRSVVTDTEKTLEEAMAKDQGTDETAQNRTVISDNPFLEAIYPINSINDSKALISTIREAAALGAGAVGYIFFGPTGAAITGLFTCTAFDGLHTGAQGNKDGPQGVWAFITKKPEDIRTAVEIILSDALVGYTGGRFSEKSHRSSEIDAFERIKELRASLGLNNPVAEKEVWTEVQDLETETGKMYYGVNKKIRRKVKLTEPRDPKLNLYVRDHPIEEELPIKRDAGTCAETHAFHEMKKENPNADVTNTQVHTFNLGKHGQYKNMTRCDNCMTRDHHMGKVPTDILRSGFINDPNIPLNLPSDYYLSLIVPPTWYSTERTIMTRAEYNKCIRLAFSVYRQLKEKIQLKRKN